jgi:mono/diheme cytochrome c family protein
VTTFNQFILYSILSLTVLTSCGNYEEFKEDPSALFQGAAGLGELTFSQIKEEVFDAQCARCHGQEYSNYNDVIANLDAIVASVRSDRMPKDGPLSLELKQKLFTWVASGAPQGDVVIVPIKPEPTFASLGRTIFATKCIRCHTEGGPSPFYLNDRQNLMAYASVFNPFLFDFEFPEEGDFIKRLVSDDPVEQMPPARSGLELLTDEERAIIIEWIKQGLP